MAKIVQGNGKGESKNSESNQPQVSHALADPGDYEITEDSTFTIEVPLARHKDGHWRWDIVYEDDAERIEEVIFKMWTYDEMVELRNHATKYDQLKRIHMLDHDALNRLKIQKLLKAWSFGGNNVRLNIHHVNGVMTDESWQAFSRLQPNIIRFIIDRMNEWYES